jgi:hypothetical protein
MTQPDFERLVATNALVPGVFYYVPNIFYLAQTPNTFYTYGGASVSEIVNELLQRETFCTELVETFTTNETFRQSVVQTLIGDPAFQIFVAEILLSDVEFRTAILQTIAHVVTKELVIDVIAEVVSIVAPDGTTVATNNGGKLTLQAATNSQFGIVKGQANNTPAAWHNVSAANGMLSINREHVESVMDTKDIAVKNAINVRAEDGCMVGHNENGIVVLPIRQVENEPVTPTGGTLYLIAESPTS